jgi:CRISPR-associated endonuclease/helicase Cas3
MHYAHTLPPPKTQADWEPLYDHLRRVAEGDSEALTGAARFAEPFGGQEWARLLGWWHDLGKYSEAFQDYLSANGTPSTGDDGHSAAVGGGRVDHSTAGAQHAARLGQLGRLLAYCIAGHHAGLPDAEAGDAGLSARLRKPIEPFAAAPVELLSRPLPLPPKLRLVGGQHRAAFAVAFFTRMLFSCLVDADFLATEWFVDNERAARRPPAGATTADLLGRLDSHLEHVKRAAVPTDVNVHRHAVLSACRDKATCPPGFFSLNVPTGGGKTLSSLAFALSHAARHGLGRVVYAIPFTSITEQTADVFRKALGDLHAEVLEHHSNLEPDDPRRQSARSRLAAENFDARLIVTTNVQLFESLFACRTSRCRKLHRLARSVVVLDEAQTLPPKLLAPTLAALDELDKNYGTTVVLCTATQPAIEKRSSFPIGVDGVVPIIDKPHALHRALRRTQVELAGTLTDEELAARLASERQALCIVNSRRHAADLFALTDGPNTYHLSANMCPRHRTAVLRLIRWKLRLGLHCRVISTQVIEAGVDVDFPAVYRAAAGLDSIAQAAGRCNREGRLLDDRGQSRPGRVVVFDYDERAHRPPPFVRRAAAHFREVAPDHREDLLSPAAIEAFFRLHYWQQGGDDGRGWDKGRDDKSVMVCFGGVSGEPLHHQFREAADRYQLVDDLQTPVVVPYRAQGGALVTELNRMPDAPDPRWLRSFDRRAQRYVVTVHDHVLRTLLENQLLFERHGRYYLANRSAYDRKRGLVPEEVGLGAELLMQ